MAKFFRDETRKLAGDRRFGNELHHATHARMALDEAERHIRQWLEARNAKP